jgi:hypothetical protein
MDEVVDRPPVEIRVGLWDGVMAGSLDEIETAVRLDPSMDRPDFLGEGAAIGAARQVQFDEKWAFIHSSRVGGLGPSCCSGPLHRSGAAERGLAFVANADTRGLCLA